MSDHVTNYLTGINQAVGASAIIYTNTSGAAQAIEVWDWALSVSMLHNVAAAANGLAQWSIGGVLVGTCFAGVGSTGGATANSVYMNARGRQYLLANGATITLANSGFCAFQNSALHLACNITVGTP